MGNVTLHYYLWWCTTSIQHHSKCMTDQVKDEVAKEIVCFKVWVDVASLRFEGMFSVQPFSPGHLNSLQPAGWDYQYTKCWMNTDWLSPEVCVLKQLDCDTNPHLSLGVFTKSVSFTKCNLINNPFLEGFSNNCFPPARCWHPTRVQRRVWKMLLTSCCSYLEETVPLETRCSDCCSVGQDTSDTLFANRSVSARRLQRWRI